jgi:hypothetical protein
MRKPQMPERSERNTWHPQESTGKVLLPLLSCRCLSSESAEARANRETQPQTPEGCKVHLPFREAEGIPSETQHLRCTRRHKGLSGDKVQKSRSGG